MLPGVVLQLNLGSLTLPSWNDQLPGPTYNSALLMMDYCFYGTSMSVGTSKTFVHFVLLHLCAFLRCVVAVLLSHSLFLCILRMLLAATVIIILALSAKLVITLNTERESR